MSINTLLFAEGPTKLPRLLLLDADPQDAAAVSLAMGNHCLPFAFGEIYRSAVAALLNESGHHPTPIAEGDGGVVKVGDNTFLRRNLEMSLEHHLCSAFGSTFTADMMAKRLHDDMPYFACCSIEDASVARATDIHHLCNHLLAIAACAAHEITWLSISDTPATAITKFPDWTLDLGIRIAARPTSEFTTPAEILSALEQP